MIFDVSQHAIIYEVLYSIQLVHVHVHVLTCQITNTVALVLGNPFYCFVQVYGSSSGGKINLIACLEDHKFSPQNFWLVNSSY